MYYITEQSLSSSRFKPGATFDFSSSVSPSSVPSSPVIYSSSSHQNDLDFSDSDNSSVISNVTCYSCGEDGHMSSRCPNIADYPSEESHSEDKEAYQQYLARTRSSSNRSSFSRSSSPEIKESENINNLGAAWPNQIYMLSAVPKRNTYSAPVIPSVSPPVLISPSVSGASACSSSACSSSVPGVSVPHSPSVSDASIPSGFHSLSVGASASSSPSVLGASAPSGFHDLAVGASASSSSSIRDVSVPHSSSVLDVAVLHSCSVLGISVPHSSSGLDTSILHSSSVLDTSVPHSFSVLDISVHCSSSDLDTSVPRSSLVLDASVSISSPCVPMPFIPPPTSMWPSHWNKGSQFEHPIVGVG